MPRIIWKYVLKEAAVPSLVALFGLTFILLTAAKVSGFGHERLPLTLIRLFFREEIDKGDLFAILMFAFPVTLLFIMPVALLLGIIIGIGRMTLDLEVRAVQTGGMHLFSVFLPVLALGALLSGVAGFCSYSAVPRIARRSIERAGNLLLTELTTLEAGRFYDELFEDELGMHLYFDERGEERGTMEGMVVMLDPQTLDSAEETQARERRLDERKEKLRLRAERGEISPEQLARWEYELEIDETTDRPIMIFAGEGKFIARTDPPAVRLDFDDGEVHLLEAPREVKVPPSARPIRTSALPEEESPLAAAAVPKEVERDYLILKFGKLSKTWELNEIDLRKDLRAWTVPELRRVVNDPEARDKKRNEAQAVILQRYSISLQSLVMAFIGIPLAIRVRPTGKSVGALLAFGLILVYHWLMRTGFSVVDSGHLALGTLVTFSPNFLYAAVGAVLWWRVINR